MKPPKCSAAKLNSRGRLVPPQAGPAVWLGGALVEMPFLRFLCRVPDMTFLPMDFERN